MLLAMAIGVTFYQEPDAEILRTQAKKWVYAAQSWLSEIPYEKSRLNIAGLQLHCLFFIARQSLVVVDDLVWISKKYYTTVLNLTGLESTSINSTRLKLWSIIRLINNYITCKGIYITRSPLTLLIP
jgi:hypothetical protein